MEAISNISVKVRKHEGLSSWMKRSNILVSFCVNKRLPISGTTYYAIVYFTYCVDVF